MSFWFSSLNFTFRRQSLVPTPIQIYVGQAVQLKIIIFQLILYIQVTHQHGVPVKLKK